ncbi:methionyl-tRNA formyltransferase [Candidatus Falkowbacteria bacterium HGW-Falkowbacteria-2]|uniref:Methionyl-tRNA formyltransferase n=1 Tax=Candidatus Falkowbacteria bacterium HGW-Falkowbacteria-2 TaxID=2013769 RepID=A0A2N2DYZ1_9BACT|nr:MAG: methionyl-tRNA formyltransferase [Candidatus Falkowbacteria bacterium HGW-Falkowbacteria-2]
MKRMNKQIRTIFMGTPDFAVPGLKALIEAPDFEVIAVITQPDKPVGRKHILHAPPVKTVALEAGIQVIQPEKIKTEIDHIAELKPDLVVVIAYGKIIPQAILDIPQYGCINVHASLLPRHRGASCLQAPILKGESETGVTIMLMDAGLDTGPILRQEKIELKGDETLTDLHDTLSELGAKALIPTLSSYCEGGILPVPQDETLASYIGLMTKENGRLTPMRTATELERRVRALNPWPGTYIELPNGEHIKVLKAEVDERDHKRAVGEIYTENNELFLACRQNSLRILKLQRENRNALDASDFLKGATEIIGQVVKSDTPLIQE